MSQSCLFRLRHFAAQCSSLHSKQRKNEPLPVKKRSFLTFYARCLDSLMTSKTASFGVDKKLSLSRFQYTFFLTVRMCKKWFILCYVCHTAFDFAHSFYCSIYYNSLFTSLPVCCAIVDNLNLFPDILTDLPLFI